MNHPSAVLRLPAACAVTGLGKSTIHAKCNPKSPIYDPTFPKKIKLGEGRNAAIGWLESDLAGWINSRLELSRKAA